MPSSPPPPGVYVPAVLFFDQNEEFDFQAIESHILRLARGGVNGILVQGSNGEAQHLSREERIKAIRFTREVLDKNGFQSVLVIAGTGAQSTRETIQLCKEAKDAGASFVLVLTPSTWVPMMTKEIILRFHRTVADQSPIPLMIYNFPTVTAGQNLKSGIISELAQHPNIVGTKLSCGDIGKTHRLASLYGKGTEGAEKYGEFATFPGKSDVFLPGLLMSSHGIIGALVNLAPKAHASLFRLFQEGELEEALRIQTVLTHADAAVSNVGGIGGLKRAINQYFGYGEGYVRRPLSVAKDEQLQVGEDAEWIKKCVELEKSL